MTLHRRQFLIGPRPIAAASDWVSVTLGDGRHLSHCPSLPVVGGERLLLGVAVSTDPAARSPADAVADPTDPLDTRQWAGRWVLLARDGVETDAAGTFACFWRRIDGAVWVSSSPALLAGLEPVVEHPGVRPTHASGMDWFPPPASGLPGIAQLLPTQRLAADGAVTRRPLPSPPADREPTLVLDGLAARLRAAVAALAERGEPLWLPLSAGRDSRVLLAAVHAAGVPAVAYTFARAGMDPADRDLPPRLAAAVGLPHRLIDAQGGVDPARLELFDRHSAGRCVDVDRSYFARGQLDRVPAGAIELGGGVFEAGRCYYHAKLPESPGADPAATARAVLAALPSVCPDGVRRWAEWLHATPDEPLDWRDRFYIEQRSAGWLAAIGQARDLSASTKVHVASCAAYLAETLALPIDVRRAGHHHGALVRRLAPELVSFTFNPPPSLAARLQRRVRREAALLREHGGAATYLRERGDRFARAWSARRVR